MTDLIDFIRAQIDYDERDSERVHYSLCSAVALRGPGRPCDCGFPDQRRAEVDAKRRILDVWEREDRSRNVHAEGEARAWLMDEVVAALALPYADRPGYLKEWRP